jgi:hypothetical protein
MLCWRVDRAPTHHKAGIFGMRTPFDYNSLIAYYSRASIGMVSSPQRPDKVIQGVFD